MAIIVGYVAVLFILVQSLAISTAMEGKIGWVEALFPIEFILGLFALGAVINLIGWAWNKVFPRKAAE